MTNTDHVTPGEISDACAYWRKAHPRDGGPLWAQDARDWSEGYALPTAYLRGLLAAADWTQAAAAAACGVTPRGARKWAAGRESTIPAGPWIVLRGAALGAVRAKVAVRLHPAHDTDSFALAAAGFDPLNAVATTAPGADEIIGWAQRGIGPIDPRGDFLPVVKRAVPEAVILRQMEGLLSFYLPEHDYLPGWAADGGLLRQNLGQVAKLPRWLPADLRADLEAKARASAEAVLQRHHEEGWDWTSSDISRERYKELIAGVKARRIEIGIERGWEHTHDWLSEWPYETRGRIPVYVRKSNRPGWAWEAFTVEGLWAGAPLAYKVDPRPVWVDWISCESGTYVNISNKRA